MVIQVNGEIIRNKAMVRISIAMAKDMKVDGLKIKNMEKDLTNTKMEIRIMGNGRKIIGMAKVPCHITMLPHIQDRGKKANNMEEEHLLFHKVTIIMDFGRMVRCMAKEFLQKQENPSKLNGSMVNF